MKSDHQNIKLINPKMAEMTPPISKDISNPPEKIKINEIILDHFLSKFTIMKRELRQVGNR